MSSLLELMTGCAPFLLGGESRSDTFPSLSLLSQMHYLPLGRRADWERGTSASGLSWASGRMGRARDEQHEVWSEHITSAVRAVFCGEVLHVKGRGG